MRANPATRRSRRHACMPWSGLSKQASKTAAYRSHAQAMAQFAEQAFDEHWTQTDAVCIPLMKPEIENLRTALHWAIAHSDAELAAIAGNVWPLFRMIDRQYES